MVPLACCETFSRMPTAASVGTSDDPPYEMNGSGIPFVGTSESTTLILKSACDHDARHDSQTQQHSKSVGREQSSANAAPEKKRKHCNDCQRANQTKLLANHGKNKIGVSKRKKQHLLFALCKTKTVDSTRSDRNQRLHHLKPRALWIRPGIEKRDQIVSIATARRSASLPRPPTPAQQPLPNEPVARPRYK